MKKLLLLSLFAGLMLQSCSGQKEGLTAGDKVPQFALKNQNDSLIHIKDYIGKEILVIYFYPKDESPVCTKEACTFRDSIPDFTKAGAMVIGINSGSVASHKEFCQHRHLPFTLLSDPGDSVMHMFGLKGGFSMGRVTYVVDLTGQIVYSFNSMLHGPEHVQKALEFIHEMADKGKGIK